MTTARQKAWRIREAGQKVEDFHLLMNTEHGKIRRVITNALDREDEVEWSLDGWNCNEIVTDKISLLLALSAHGNDACDSGKANVVSLLMSLGNALPFHARTAGCMASGLSALSIWSMAGMPLYYEVPALEVLAMRLVPHWDRFIMSDRVNIRFSHKEKFIVSTVGRLVIWARESRDRYGAIKRHKRFYDTVAEEFNFDYDRGDVWAMRLALSGKIIV